MIRPGGRKEIEKWPHTPDKRNDDDDNEGHVTGQEVKPTSGEVERAGSLIVSLEWVEAVLLLNSLQSDPFPFSFFCSSQSGIGGSGAGARLR